MKRHDIKLTVPDSLKALLVDDWENVTKNQQLVPLPRNPTVVQILQKYRESIPKKREGSADADVFDEVIAGLKLYFDRSLGTILLYRFERQQYMEIRKEHPNKEPSEIYGAEHLLRLFGEFSWFLAEGYPTDWLQFRCQSCLHIQIWTRSRFQSCASILRILYASLQRILSSMLLSVMRVVSFPP
jgi:MRG